MDGLRGKKPIGADWRSLKGRSGGKTYKGEGEKELAMEGLSYTVPDHHKSTVCA